MSDTLSKMSGRRAGKPAGGRAPAGDDERLFCRPPQQGCARDHVVTLNGGRAFVKRTCRYVQNHVAGR